jgi:hypothetical protein
MLKKSIIIAILCWNGLGYSSSRSYHGVGCLGWGNPYITIEDDKKINLNDWVLAGGGGRIQLFENFSLEGRVLVFTPAHVVKNTNTEGKTTGEVEYLAGLSDIMVRGVWLKYYKLRLYAQGGGWGLKEITRTKRLLSQDDKGTINADTGNAKPEITRDPPLYGFGCVWGVGGNYAYSSKWSFGISAAHYVPLAFAENNSLKWMRKNSVGESFVVIKLEASRRVY